MTNEEIQYVRTKNGIIGTLIEISKAGNGVRYAGEFITDTIISIYIKPHKEVRVKDKEVKSHSSNLLDLIEEGDYVNGDKVIKKYNDYLMVGTEFINQGIANELIETIVTKEQFKSMEYEVGE